MEQKVILTPAEIQRIETAIERAADVLHEHGCDSVRLFATTHTSGGRTVRFSAGRGNWFAQKGVVDLWVEDNKNQALASELDPPQPEEPPDEEWKG